MEAYRFALPNEMTITNKIPQRNNCSFKGVNSYLVPKHKSWNERIHMGPPIRKITEYLAAKLIL